MTLTTIDLIKSSALSPHTPTRVFNLSLPSPLTCRITHLPLRLKTSLPPALPSLQTPSPTHHSRLPSSSPPQSSNNHGEGAPVIIYQPPTIWSILRGAAINLLLPFVNGMMLGFGELLAHEFAFRLGWGGTNVSCTRLSTRSFTPCSNLLPMLSFCHCSTGKRIHYAGSTTRLFLTPTYTFNHTTNYTPTYRSGPKTDSHGPTPSVPAWRCVTTQSSGGEETTQLIPTYWT